MKRILITGANSFIGSFFKFYAKELQVNEVCLINNKVGDIDFTTTDVVFHVAAIVHQDKNIPDEKYFEINSDLAYNVAVKAKNDGVKHFVFMSTVKVYGENNTSEFPWKENTVCTPSDAYGKSKLDAEKRLLTLNDSNFKISIVRTPVVYGPGVKGNILKIAKLLKSRKIIPLNGINNKRAMVYIGNLAALIEKIIEKEAPGIFLANDNKTLSTSEFVKILSKSSNKKNILLPFPRFFQLLIKALKPSLYNRLFGSMILDNSVTREQLNFTVPFEPEFGLSTVMKQK